MLTTQIDEFIQAIKKGDNQRVLELLKREPSLANAVDADGTSAVFLALYRGNSQLAGEVASRKSMIDVFEAACLGKLELVKRLVDSDSSLVKSHSPDGFTALALAAYVGQKDAAEYLLSRGADPNSVAKNETGFTALTGAVSQNHNEIARLLIKNGANVNYVYEGGFTPLMHAAAAGNGELVKILVDGGADPTTKNSEGKTALAFARENKHYDVVELLNKHGAA